MYHSNNNDLEDKASHERGNELSDPIKESGWDADVASNCYCKGNCRVDVSTRDVPCDVQNRGQSKCICNATHYHTRWVQ